MNAVRAEWTKLRTTPGPAWLLLAAAAATVSLDVTQSLVRGVYLGQIPVAVLGVLVIGGEYGTALIGTTLTAIPRRPAVMAAKAAVLAAAMCAAAVPILAAAPLAARLTLRAAAGSAAHLVLIALLALGTAAAARDSAAAIGTVLGLLYLPPILTQLVTDPDLHRRLARIAPMTGGPVALAAWSAGALLTGTLLLQLRDT
ncbi:ABC transporter permease [Dactylosporangium sp. CA-139066]|uniref:ABC transporter permease n=1 Tax=Dactylosporangium sp. CA-139066 TaxID=3239930 RepID=UPI003D908D9B